MTMNIEYCLLPPTGSAVLSGPVGNWWLEWCEQGLLAAASTSARPNNRPLPFWLHNAWESFWIGEKFDLVLCTSRPLSPFLTRIYNAILRLLPAQGTLMTASQFAQNCGVSLASLAQALKKNPWPLFLPVHRVIAESEKSFGSHMERFSAQLRAYETSMRDLGSQMACHFDVACNWFKHVTSEGQ